jgi:hypothetical protein
MLSFLTGPAESSRVRVRAFPLRFSASASGLGINRHPPPPNNSFKPTPHRGVNSVLCATLHAVAAPLRGGLTQALEPMPISSDNESKNHFWLVFFPFWGLPLFFCLVTFLEVKLKFFSSIPGGNFINDLFAPIALAIFLSGGYPILKSNGTSTASRLLMAGLYYLFAAILIGFVGFFFGWWFLLAIGVQP